MAVKAISGPMYVKLYASGSIPSDARLAKNTTPLITWLTARIIIARAIPQINPGTPFSRNSPADPSTVNAAR